MNRSEENLAIARTIQLTPSREGLRSGARGVIAAERHPTGWFISARFDPDLPPSQIDDFAHFVLVRTYLLLEHGPQPEAWQADGNGVWRAYCVDSKTSMENLPLTA